ESTLLVCRAHEGNHTAACLRTCIDSILDREGIVRASVGLGTVLTWITLGKSSKWQLEAKKPAMSTDMAG
ncbi:MAG: hypothetical protein VX290_18450, partial [Candidatus Latescibacterota bacterium]|nr:hypothetical protein [Candidatus Latescibacterota bacterium]